MLNLEDQESDNDHYNEEDEKLITKQATTIYCLTHARYIQTSKGMEQMVFYYFI